MGMNGLRSFQRQPDRENHQDRDERGPEAANFPLIEDGQGLCTPAGEFTLVVPVVGREPGILVRSGTFRMRHRFGDRDEERPSPGKGGF